MGYYTRFEFKVVEAEDESDPIADFKALSYGADYAFDEDGNANDSLKWYDWRNDLLLYTQTYPQRKVTLSGEGEDPADLWKAYAFNGEVEVAQANISYSPVTLW
jgi:hypothetical protein